MKFLLDTNVFREVGKSQPHENVEAWLKSVDDADLAVSVITVREIHKGIAKLRPRKPEVAEAIAIRVDAAFAALDDRLLSITREIAVLWGELLAERDKHVDDVGLAATARTHGLVLVTRNHQDVSGRGVDTLDPYRRPHKIIKASAQR